MLANLSEFHEVEILKTTLSDHDEIKPEITFGKKSFHREMETPCMKQLFLRRKIQTEALEFLTDHTNENTKCQKL